MDYLKLYDLEKYLFDVVRSNFERDRRLSAFDFFCIIIWKANRAKSKIAKKLLEKDGHRRKDLDAIVGDVTKSLADDRFGEGENENPHREVGIPFAHRFGHTFRSLAG